MSHTNIPKGLKPVLSPINYGGTFKTCYISSSVIDGVTIGYDQHNIFDGDAVVFDNNNVISLYSFNESKEPEFWFMGCEYIDLNGDLIKSDDWIAGTKIQTGTIIKAIIFSFNKKEDDNIISN